MFWEPRPGHLSCPHCLAGSAEAGVGAGRGFRTQALWRGQAGVGYGQARGVTQALQHGQAREGVDRPGAVHTGPVWRAGGCGRSQRSQQRGVWIREGGAVKGWELRGARPPVRRGVGGGQAPAVGAQLLSSEPRPAVGAPCGLTTLAVASSACSPPGNQVAAESPSGVSPAQGPLGLHT